MTTHEMYLVDTCNGWNGCMNGTTSMPMSVPRYVVDKVKLILFSLTRKRNDPYAKCKH